jgi:hypothetical protein
METGRGGEAKNFFTNLDWGGGAEKNGGGGLGTPLCFLNCSYSSQYIRFYQKPFLKIDVECAFVTFLP